MPVLHLRLCVPSLPVNRLPNNHLSPQLCYIVYCTQFRARTEQSSCRVFFLKNKSPPIGLVSSFTGIHASRALSVVDTEETCDLGLGDCCEQKPAINSSEKNTSTDKVQSYSFSSFAESHINEDQKERERRRKIGLANKGNVPWNKGRKHSPETREWIRQRTKEALTDPKIRKKLSERHRAQSDRTKAKIGSSLRRAWGERLKWKKSRAKFLSSWAENIAEAAKKGGSGQRELHWDSYDKIKEELVLQQHQWAADQAKAKEAKAERMARRAQKRKEEEQKAKARGETGSENNRKTKEEREELAIAQELKLKERLTKIHRRKTSKKGQIGREDRRAWEKLDLESVKGEQTRKEVSLADQIQAAKTKRVDCVDGESLPTAYSLYSVRDHQSERFS